MMDGYGMFGFGPLLMILWWVLIIIGIAALVKWAIGSSGVCRRCGRGGVGGALDILNERYARGEIEEEEYKRKKRDLGQ